MTRLALLLPLGGDACLGDGGEDAAIGGFGHRYRVSHSRVSSQWSPAAWQMASMISPTVPKLAGRLTFA